MSVADQTSSDKYADAEVRSPYRDADYDQEVIVTLGAKRESKNWKPQKSPLGAFIAGLCVHKEGPKDGPSFVLADMVPGQRLKNSVKAIYAIGLDIDTGTPTEAVDNALLALGCVAIRYTTHSHGKISSEFKKDKVLKHFPEAEITTELMREFVKTIEHWDDSIVDTVEFAEEDHTDKGIVVRIAHIPMPKHRVIVPLMTPYEIAKEGKRCV